jgi:uncharacterized membrane protein
MIEAHTLDSWTRLADRDRIAYGWAMFIGGLGAPAFLFLAGTAVALGAGARLRNNGVTRDVVRRWCTRGSQIFGLAFLFRLQSWLISGGEITRSLLKVDILNIMGPTMVVAALLWGWGRTSRGRVWLWTSAAVVVVALSPPIREAASLARLPDFLEMYLRPFPGRTSFAFFPWSAFLFSGAAVGLFIDAAQTPAQERKLNLTLGALGALVWTGAACASFLPSIYGPGGSWSSSPAFFLLRLGLLLVALPLAFVASHRLGGSWLRDLGIASLFVYWIHVEIVYGVLTAPLHRRFTLEQSVVAFLLFSVLMGGAVKLQERVIRQWRANWLQPTTARS